MALVTLGCLGVLLYPVWVLAGPWQLIVAVFDSVRAVMVVGTLLLVATVFLCLGIALLASKKTS
jgi:hypothetical protein